MANCWLFPFLILIFLRFQSLLTAQGQDPSYKSIHVEVILDMESWVGKVFMIRDTKREPLRALDILGNSEMKAIIGPDLEVLGDKANVPILSFSTFPLLNQNPYRLQDETARFKGIADHMLESFKAKNVMVNCDDTANGREMVTYMVSKFQEKSIHVTYTGLISTSASNEQVGENFRKFRNMQPMVFAVHTRLLNQMLRINFHGLGGEFKLISKSMEVVNGKKKFLKRRMLKSNGKKLRILVPGSAFPNILQVSVDPRTNLSTVSGYCGDVFNAVVKALDYGARIDIIPLPYKDGISYNDLIDKIYLKEYDALIGDVTITSNRSLYVDFTLPFTDLGIGTIAQNPKKNMWIFLNPLSADLWITSSIFFLFLGFVIWFIEHRTNKEFQGSANEQIGTTLWFAFSTLVYAPRENLQSNLSRFVVTVWFFVVLVLTSSYTATLSSHLTVEQIGGKVMSIVFQGLSPVGGDVFNNLNFAGKKIQKLYTPEAYAKALTTGSVDAIIDEILYVKTVLANYPDFSLIATASSTTNGFAFVFQKGSPLVGEMSSVIAKMREDGTLKALEEKWIKHQSAVMSLDFSPPSPGILNLYRLRGLYLISGVTMLFAFLVSIVRLVLEKLHIIGKMQILRCILRRSSEIHVHDGDEESST